MSCKTNLYRIIDPSTNCYISEVYGFVRFEDTIGPDSAFIYNKQDALFIRNRLIRLYRNLDKGDNNTLAVNPCKNPQLIPVTIEDVFLNDSDMMQAIDSASALGITLNQSINNVRWQRVRKYKNLLYFGLDLQPIIFLFKELAILKIISSSLKGDLSYFDTIVSLKQEF